MGISRVFFSDFQHTGSLKTVHFRHLDVENDQVDAGCIERDIKRLLAGGCLQNLYIHVLPDQRAECEQVVLVIVDDQKCEARISIHNHIVPPAAYALKMPW